MKSQVDYFDRIIKIFKSLKKDHPDVELSKHYSLATCDHGDFLSDKELFQCLQEHKTALDVNTLTIKDINKVIEDGEKLFDPEADSEEHDQWNEEEEWQE